MVPQMKTTLLLKNDITKVVVCKTDDRAHYHQLIVEVDNAHTAYIMSSRIMHLTSDATEKSDDNSVEGAVNNCV